MTVSRPRRAAIVVVGLAALALGGGAALAGHEPGLVPSYTGCLNPTSGTLVNVAPGDAPAAACKEKETTVHLSGGDVTGVTAGAGLTGGGEQGAVELGIDPDAIPTGVEAGFGLVGGGSGGDVTLGVDPTVVQRRVVASCGGAGISKVNQDGSGTCAAGGYVATLHAGFLAAEGKHDPDLCDEGFNEDGNVGGPFTSTSAAVHLEAGRYQVVPAGFRWKIAKTVEYGDEEVFYAGEVGAEVGGSVFRRQVNTRGLILDGDKDFGTFEVSPGGSDVALEITVYAWDCSRAEIGGAVDIVRID